MSRVGLIVTMREHLATRHLAENCLEQEQDMENIAEAVQHEAPSAVFPDGVGITTNILVDPNEVNSLKRLLFEGFVVENACLAAS